MKYFLDPYKVIDKYTRSAVDFVQYLLKKPIKHGLKVFAICCAVTAVLFGFEVYCGKDTGVSATAIAIVEADCSS